MSGKHSAGKGDHRRPCLVSHEQYAANYDRIFRSVQTWHTCEKHPEQGMNSRNPCPKCGREEQPSGENL